MADEPFQLDNPFWRFSLEIYGKPGVSDVCLKVQDRLGGDVNLLLYCAWLGAVRGAQIDEAAVGALQRSVADWNAAAVWPLRSARQAIKALPAHRHAVIAEFRKDVAALELRAEQIAEAMLYAEGEFPAAHPGSGEIAAANIALYIGMLKDAAKARQDSVSLTALIEAAAAFAG
jgi:uncharacterized protein (TIGR02444 family)